ncbi:prenyltransferase [uncultured Jatrophihabitans sp.]|uniref:prenyltransferase n=1 Tax=uncultured Jatrophihabitans sp. TaxID=1610747 RepID=UPI0035CC87E2
MSTEATTPTGTARTPEPGPAPAAGTPPRGGPFAFVGAFTGFYPAQASEFSHLDPVTRFLYAARSVILVISAQSALMAGLLAATDRRFEWLPFVLVFLAYVVLHAVSNLSNDYFGYRRGHDTDDSPRRRYTLHPVASGAVTPRLLATGLVVLAAVSVAIAAYFIALRGLPALWLALVGGILLYAYDAAPRALKELSLGELAAFVVWGPLMIGGGYYVIAGHWSGVAFAASVPPGLGVMSILVGKHVDQREFDTGQHQRTLPVVLGERAARTFTAVSVVAMYVVTALLVALGDLTPFALLIVVAGPRALHALRVLSRPAPASPPAGYVGWPLWYHRVCLVHNRAFGWLYVAGLVVGAVFPEVLIG